MMQNERNLYLFTDPECEVDAVGSGLMSFFFCLYWEPPGLPFPLMVIHILLLLMLYFFCNLDHEVLFNSYFPHMR